MLVAIQGEPEGRQNTMAENLSLNALRAFESVARHGSFKAAAEELFVTPAAISQQIKSLEDNLGVKLFHRQSRSITLTKNAQRGIAKASEGFNNLTEAIQLIKAENDNTTLTVWSSPSFASKWLVPRLAEFTRANPGIDLEISAERSLIDTGENNEKGSIQLDMFKREEVDIAIRFGQGVYDNCTVDKALTTPDDLRHQTLLHDATPYEGRPSWSVWLEAAGVENIDAEHGITFNSVNLALAAAAEGQGVVFTLEALAQDDIEAGRLVAPFDLSLPMSFAYYMITLEEFAEKPKVKRFRDWLLTKAHSETNQ